ncbi:putative reverse transcriptase domain-containing protein, partial [Tanacetum coccineum]
KKRQKPKSKKPPTETKVTPLKPTEGSEQSHSVSSGTVLDPQDLERNIQLASTGLPSTLDEGTRKLKPLPEVTATHPKDSRGNIQPLDMDLTSMISDEGTTKTATRPEWSLRDKDLGGNIPPTDIEPTHPTIADLSGTGAKYQVDKTQPTILRYWSLTKNKGKTSSEVEPDIEPLQLQTVVDIQAFLISEDEFEKESNEEEVLAAREDMVEDPQATKEVRTPSPKPILRQCYSNTCSHSLPANVEGENATNTATKDPQSHAEGESDSNKQEKPNEVKHSIDAIIELIGSSKPQPLIPQAQPITIINPELIISQREGKGIATDDQVEDQGKLVKASSIISRDPNALIPYTINGEVYYLNTKQFQAHMDKEEIIKKAEEEAKFFEISKPEMIKVVQEEAKKLGINPKEAISTKAGEKFKKARDAEHEVLKRKHIKKVKKSLELKKHKYDNYMWTINSRLKPKTITNIKIHLKIKPIIITVYRGIDGRNFQVHNLFLFSEFGISELDEPREIIPTKKNTVVKDLMNSISQRYERIKEFLEELRNKSAIHAPAPVKDLMNSISQKTCSCLYGRSVSYLQDAQSEATRKTLAFSESKEDHEVHLKLVLELLRKEKMFAKYEWGVKQEEAFQTLKDNLCNAPILLLPDGEEDFVVYCDASNQGLGCLLMQRGKVIAYASRQLKIQEKNYTTHDLELGAVVFALKIWRHYLYGTKTVIYTDHKSLQHVFDQKALNMCQRRCIELFSDYDYEIRYHPGKANVVADMLSRKEWVKPKRVRAMSMKIRSNLKEKLLVAENEAIKEENAPAKMLHGLDQQMKKMGDRGLYYMDRIWVPLISDIRTMIMGEAHAMRCSIHPRADKMYYDLRDMYWWPGMKKDIATYVSKCLTCSKVKAEHQRPSGLLQQPKIPEWKWDKITMDFIYKLSRTTSGHDTIWVIVDRLTKSAYFLMTREDYSMKKLSRLYIDEIMTRYKVPMSIISDQDGLFTSRFWRTLHKALGTQLDMMALIKEKLKAARDCQKRYADNRHKPLEFEVNDQVLLKVSPWKGAELSSVHDTFHVSNLEKCLADANLHVALEEIKVDKTLCFVEELEEIMDCEVKNLKRSRVPIVKLCWNSKRGPQLT